MPCTTQDINSNDYRPCIKEKMLTVFLLGVKTFRFLNYRAIAIPMGYKCRTAYP